MEKKQIKLISSLLPIFLFLVLLVFMGFFFPAQTIIDSLGFKNGYLLSFVVSFLGGVSTITSSSFFAILFVISLTTLNPIILSIFVGLGLFLGDLIFFGIGSRVRDSLGSGVISKFLIRMEKFFSTKPRFVMWIFVFIYTGFTPFPGDILMFSLAAVGYKIKDFAIPLLLGNVMLAFTIWFIAQTGQNILAFIF